jgi:dihydrofolate reductase
MGKIKAITNVTLDGVMQSPARPEEDPRDGFEHGGWAAPYAAMQQPEAGDAFANMGALLFGRWTYESFYDYWPTQTDNPFTGVLNSIRKYVVSTTLNEPLPWSNSVLIKRDVPRTLERVKEDEAQGIVVFGSGVLIQSLMRWNVLDELTLLIHPLILGSGRRLLPAGGVFTGAPIRNAKTTSNGVVIVTYQPVSAAAPVLAG